MEAHVSGQRNIGWQAQGVPLSSHSDTSPYEHMLLDPANFALLLPKSCSHTALAVQCTESICASQWHRIRHKLTYTNT